MHHFLPPLLSLLSLPLCHRTPVSSLLADSFATLLIATSLTFTPIFFLTLQIDVRLDPLSPHLARIIGLLFLSLSLQSHRASQSPSRFHKVVHFSSRTFPLTMFLLSTIFAALHYREWNHHFITITVFGALCWLLPHIYYTLTIVHPIPSSHSSHPISFFLLLDSLMTSTLALIWYAYPSYLIRLLTHVKPNGVSVTLGRILGSLLFALGLESNAATHYPDLSSRKSIHLSRIILSAPLITFVFYAVTLHGVFNTAHLLLGVAAIVLWALNSVLGYGMIALVEHSEREKKARKEAFERREASSWVAKYVVRDVTRHERVSDSPHTVGTRRTEWSP